MALFRHVKMKQPFYTMEEAIDLKAYNVHADLFIHYISLINTHTRNLLTRYLVWQAYSSIDVTGIQSNIVYIYQVDMGIWVTPDDKPNSTDVNSRPILSRDTHIGNILTKANRSFWFIRRNLGRCPTNIKWQAYLSLVRPHLQYASSVWDPHLQKHIYQIEMVKRRAARFIKHEYSRDPGIVTSILQELELQALQERRKTSRLLVFHKIIHQMVAIPLPPYL